MADWGEDGWHKRWVKSDWKRTEGKAGSFKHTAGKWSGDPDDKGIFIFLNLPIVRSNSQMKNPTYLSQLKYVIKLCGRTIWLFVWPEAFFFFFVVMRLYDLVIFSIFIIMEKWAETASESVNFVGRFTYKATSEVGIGDIINIFKRANLTLVSVRSLNIILIPVVC